MVLLARIVTQLEALATNTSGESSNFSPPTTQSLLEISSISSSTLRINSFWFLSLILSLTTVLVGIISLQWLREHQRYSDSLSPRQSLGIFHMRTEALEKWYVPQIFAMLPLLLEAALVLFFFGIVDFLLDLSHAVAIPVAVSIGLTTLFLVSTTILPTLQCFPVSLRQPLSDSPVPVPCPYKSPQSLAFRQLATFSRRFFNTAHESVILVLYFFTVQLPAFSTRILNKKPSSSRETWRYRLFSDRAYLFWAHKNWIDFDRTWIILRNEHFDITRKRQSGDTSSQSFLVEPIYDAVRGLAVAVHGNEHHDNVIFAGYHCFQDLSHSALGDQGEYPNHHLQACYRDLVPTWNSPIANIATIVVDPAFDLLHDIHTVLFLRLPGIFYKAINTSNIFGKHMLELHTRILGDLYARQPRRLSDGTSKGPTGFFHWYTINMAALVEMPEIQDGSFDTIFVEKVYTYADIHIVFYQQFFMIFNSFIEMASTIKNSGDITNTFHTHSDLDDFISLAAYLTWRTAEKAAERPKDSDTSFSSLLSTLQLISTSLSAVRPQFSKGDKAAPPHPDFLFCCATLYFVRLWQEKPQSQRTTRDITASSSIKDYTLIPQLTNLLSALERDVLKPYENTLDKPEFFKLYGSLIRPAKLPSAYFSGSGTADARDFQRYGSMMLSTISRQGTEDTCTTTVWRQMSLPMTLEDPGDVVQSFVGTRRAVSDPDTEKDRIKEEDGGVYNANAEKLV